LNVQFWKGFQIGRFRERVAGKPREQIANRLKQHGSFFSAQVHGVHGNSMNMRETDYFQ
jgi:hypothetical protein